MADNPLDIAQDKAEALMDKGIGAVGDFVGEKVDQSVKKNIAGLIPGVGGTDDQQKPLSGIDGLFASVMAGDQDGVEKQLGFFEKMAQTISNLLPKFDINFDIMGLFANIKSSLLGMVGMGGGAPEASAPPPAEFDTNAAEQQRQLEIARQAEIEQQKLKNSSPDTSKQDFEKAHDDKPTPMETERDLVKSAPQLENIVQSKL